jgi:hypothetical protein
MTCHHFLRRFLRFEPDDAPPAGFGGLSAL